MKNISHPLRSFWFCLVSVGMTEAEDEQDKKYIKFTNVVAVLTALAVFLYIPFSVLQGNYALALLQGIDVLCVLLVLLANHLGYYAIARHLYMLVINSFVLINSCLIGYESRVQDFFYIAAIVPFLLFSVKDYRHILMGVLVSIIFFNIYQIIYPFFERFNLDANTQHLIYSINLWMKFVLFGTAIYILSYYNHTTELALELSNQKLRDQAKELQRSNNDLEQFASIISHDLRAPVRNVSSFMGLLRQRYGGVMDADALNFIDLSKSSADRMASQIEDLLSYSKVGRNLPQAGLVNINSLIAIIELELGEKIKEKRVEIAIESELPILSNVHNSMIHHVFQNLIANGIKFNTNERPEVRISCMQTDGNYTFSVKDNGIGIDDENKGKLFQMFKRLHSDSEFEGTGIGLAVCKKIIEFYGGSIWLESEKGRGTCFYFTLPAHHAEPTTTYNARFSPVTSHHSLSLG